MYWFSIVVQMSVLAPEPFEQDEPFTVRLRGILAEYPPGVSILQEMLQNADDAGAKLIVSDLFEFSLLLIRNIRLTPLLIRKRISLIKGSRNIKALRFWSTTMPSFQRTTLLL